MPLRRIRSALPSSSPSVVRFLVGAALTIAVLSSAGVAQEREARTRYVISIGDHPRVDGLRLNFRDRELDRVRGANVTLWRPYDDARLGTVEGMALGLPLTGAGDLVGLGLGVAGVMVEDDAHGLMLGGIGVGAGGSLRGISIGGIGAGAGGSIRGIAIGGVGAGAGGEIRGLAIGGVGAGAGGNMRGIAVGGIGAGAGGSVRGLVIGGVGAAAGGNMRAIAIGGIGAAAGGDARGAFVGGVGVGAGGSVRGLGIGGVGVGAGGDLRGLMIGGVGVGAGGTLHGLAIGGVGVGAGERIEGTAIGLLGVGSPGITGLAIGGVVRGERVHGLVIAPALFRSMRDANVSGATVSTVNVTHGRMHGLAIGVVNYAESLQGVQLGVLNIVRDNPSGRRVLPLVNW